MLGKKRYRHVLDREEYPEASQATAAECAAEELEAGDSEPEDGDWCDVGEGDEEEQEVVRIPPRPSKQTHTHMSEELIHRVECIYACTGCPFVTMDTADMINHVEFHEAEQKAGELSLEVKEVKRQERPAPIQVPVVLTPAPVEKPPKPTLTRQQSVEDPESKAKVDAHIARQKEFEKAKRRQVEEDKAAAARAWPFMTPLSPEIVQRQVSLVVAAKGPEVSDTEAQRKIEEHLKRVEEEKKRKTANLLGSSSHPTAMEIAPTRITVPETPKEQTPEDRLAAHLAKVKAFRAAGPGNARSPVLIKCHPQCEPQPPKPLDEDFIFVNCPNCQIKIQVEITEVNCGVFRCGIFKRDGRQVPPHAPQGITEFWLQADAIRGCAQPFRLQAFEGGFRAVKCGWI